MAIGLSFGAAFGGWWLARGHVIGRERAAFDDRTRRLLDALHRRLDVYQAVAHAARALHAASGSIGREAWQAFVSSQRLTRRVAGIVGVNYVARVRAAELDEFVAANRTNGAANFDLRVPVGPARADGYSIVQFVSPSDQALPRPGVDIGRLPEHGAALAYARDSDDVGVVLAPTSTEAIVGGHGAALYLPIYRRTAVHTALAARRESIVAWVQIRIRMLDLFSGLDDRSWNDVGLTVRSPRVDGERTVLRLGSDPSASALCVTEVVEFGGQRWQLTFCSNGPANAAYDSWLPFLSLLGGLAVAISLTAVVRSLSWGRNRAIALAEVMSSSYERARANAESANQAKSEFLANMSHEIRTPMTAILGYADLLAEPELSTDERQEAIETIRRNGDHLISVINDILDLSKIEAGRMSIETIECSPVRIAEEVASLMNVRAAGKGIALMFEPSYPVPERIHTDPVRVRQILVNLVGNAIKFTETGAVTMRMSLERGDGEHQLRFDVIDSGIGMSRSQISGLFRPFTQADYSTSRRFGGTGLGLTISKRLAQMLGGDICVRSEPGRGSEFSVCIATGPLDGVRMLHELPGRLTSRQRRDERYAVHARILLAEDGPDNQRLISHVLRKAGADVCIAENGRIALDAFAAARENGEPFDIVLMDMQMPELDGYDATRELRAQGSETPVIALTAHAMTGDRERCIAAGCDDYAAKPIDRAALFAALRRHLPPGRMG